MNQHDYCDDGRFCFEMVDAFGFPLEVLVEELRRRDRLSLFCGACFLRLAHEAGWGRDRTAERLKNAFGKDWPVLEAQIWERRIAPMITEEAHG